MNVERLFKLAETAEDAELVWINIQVGVLMNTSTITQIENNNLFSWGATASGEIETLRRFHNLYGNKIVEIVNEWIGKGLGVEEMIESVAELMKTRLEA